MYLEPLRRLHDRESFDCGVESVNRFLRQTARQQAEKLLGVTQVLVEEPGSPTILGFYTLLMTGVEGSLLPLKGLPANTLAPAFLLAQFGVDQRFQGRGLGKQLLLAALWTSLEAADKVGGVAVVLDAVDEDARQFYLRFGFLDLTNAPMRMYRTMKGIRELFAESSGRPLE